MDRDKNYLNDERTGMRLIQLTLNTSLNLNL